MLVFFLSAGYFFVFAVTMGKSGASRAKAGGGVGAVTDNPDQDWTWKNTRIGRRSWKEQTGIAVIGTGERE